MEIIVFCAVVLIVGKGVLLAHADALPTTTADETQPLPNSEIDGLKKQVGSLEKIIQGMARQLMSQQFSVEEHVRSDGFSGLKLIGLNRDGQAHNYFTETHSGYSVAAIHDRSNNIRTVGMREFIGVLNGVEFRTRHNDYRLHMPSKTSKNYRETADIPFPDVPPSVSNKETVTEQIIEMRKYFEAFQKQDKGIRDYEPYFKPVICYLEGGWKATSPSDSSSVLDESEFHDIARYASYTGDSGNKEYPFLARTGIYTTEDDKPVFPHWHYSILCHQIKAPLKLKNFKLVDDFEPRLRLKKTLKAFEKSSEARFRLTSENEDNPVNSYHQGLLDQIMQEIPGKDNYQGFIEDNSFGLVKYRIDSADNTVLNAAYYHRLYKAYDETGSLTLHRRGFSDPNLFVAMTTQNEIEEVSAEDCSYDNSLQKAVCHQNKARNTYAIPLEIIWTTPLSKWNPYDVRFHDESHANYVTKDGRNGDLDQSHAFNGSSAKMFYQTPAGFYTTDADGSGDIADIFSGVVGVLDQQGNVREMAASGIRTFLPEIPDIGVIRTRYPIFPLYAEGSTTAKNLAALQEILLNMKQYSYMFDPEPEPDTVEPGFPSPGTN